MPAVYDRLARFYDGVFAPFESRWLAARRAEVLAEMPSDAAILELGAGTGANFGFYPPQRLAVAAELSCRMLAIARRREAPIHLVQADAQQLPFAADQFDAAFATLVFCSIPRPDLAFAELRRVVRTGGSVVLLEHVRPDGSLGRVFDVVNLATVALIEDHFNRETAKLVAASGLTVVSVRKLLKGAVNLIVARN